MSSNITIELAHLSHANAMAQMSKELIEHGLRWRWRAAKIQAMMLSPDVTVICVLRDARLVAFAMMEFFEDSAHLNLLAVKPFVRRTGIGCAMVEWLRKSAEVAGIASIVLEVRSDNMDARNFYERLGFEVFDFAKGYYDGKENALKMKLQLMDPIVNERRP